MPNRSMKESCYLKQSLVEGPVGLVLTSARDHTNAMTVSFFSEVSHHPTSMWISIARSSYTHELLEETRRFTFVTLHEGQGPIAVACGTASGREQNKCKQLDLYEAAEGFLCLRGALASTDCRIYRSEPMGDHTLYLAEMLSGVVERGRRARRNLLLSDLGPL